MKKNTANEENKTINISQINNSYRHSKQRASTWKYVHKLEELHDNTLITQDRYKTAVKYA